MRTRRGEVAWTLQERVHAMFQRAAWRRFRPAGFAALRSAVTAEYLIGTAAVALLVADALPARHLARLYAPFVSVVPLATLVPNDVADASVRRASLLDRDNSQRFG